MKAPIRLYQSTVLILGAGGGVGTAMSEYLARKWQCTLILSDVRADRLEEVAQTIRSAYDTTVHTIVHDMTTPESSRELFERATALAEVGIVINCMGLNYYGKTNAQQIDHFALINRINFVAPSEITMIFIEYFSRLDRPCGLLHINSLAAYASFPFQNVYAVSKRALHSFLNAIRWELKQEPYGSRITVSEIHPGSIDTDMTSMAAVFDNLSNAQRRLITPPIKIVRWAIKGFIRARSNIFPRQWYLPFYIICCYLFPHMITHIVGKVNKKLLQY